MGFIYIIKNSVNDKVYIGQTIHNINIRMSQHLARVDKGSEKLYVWMRHIGKDKFYIEMLEEVENKDLDNKENEYIIKFDSINNGYNSILNGNNKYSYSIRKLDEMLDDIISDYLSGMSFTDMSIKYDIAINTIYKYVYDYIGNRVSDTNTINNKNTSNQIIMYDLDFNPIYYFKSINDAYKFLCKNSKFKIDKRNTYAYTKRACGCGNIAYGYRWQLYSDLILESENKVFRTKFDKEAYLQGKPAYQPDGEQYYIVDGALKDILNKNILKIKRCAICNKAIDKDAKLCIECYRKQQHSNIPDKETLQQLISEYSYEAIGRMYNVTGKAVRKWADSYSLVESRQRDSSGVTCIELGLHFNTFKEAAEYLVQHGLNYKTKQHTLAYNISQAKKYNTKYLNFTWK